MKKREGGPRSALGVAWTVAWKDIVDAMKSMTTMSIILGTMVMILANQAVPLLLSRSGALRLYVLDPGESLLVKSLDAADGVVVDTFDSMEEMRESLVSSPAKVLGVDVPYDIDEQLESGSVIQLQGSVPWASRRGMTDLVLGLEREISVVTGQVGQVAVDVQLVYPESGSSGSGGIFQIAYSLQLLVVGVYIVSYLIFDEKESKTLDALLVSPASAAQVVTGKVIAGSFYCAVAAATALVIGWPAVVHWEIMLAASAAIGLVAVALGLFAGLMFDSAQQMGLWLVIPLLVMIAGMMGSELSDRLPPVVALLVGLLPTAAGAEALQLALVGDASIVDALPQLGIVLAWAALALAAAVARVRQMDR